MPVVNLKSGATPSSPFATWADAAATLAAANAVVFAGDTLNVSKAHSESTAGISLTVAGTTTSITKILGGTEDGSSGLTDISAGAVIGSSNTSFAVNGSFYAAGITWRCTSGSSTVASINSASPGMQHHDTCRFEHAGAGGASSWKFGAGTASSSSGTLLTDCVFKFAHAGQRIAVDGALRMVGGSIDAAGTAPTALFGLASSTRACELYVEGFDASGAATAVNVISSVGQSGCFAEIRRIKLPTSWSGGLVASGQMKFGCRFKMVDFSAGSTLYKLWIEDYAGQIRDESTIKVTANTRSYKMVSGADCSRLIPLVSHEYFVPLTGSAQTLTLNVVTDGVTLTDAECFMEAEYFNTSGSSLGVVLSDDAADILAPPASQASSSLTWTTTGLASPIKQALSVTLTAGYASYAIVRAVLRKAGTTVYLDDNVQVS